MTLERCQKLFCGGLDHRSDCNGEGRFDARATTVGDCASLSMGWVQEVVQVVDSDVSPRPETEASLRQGST